MDTLEKEKRRSKAMKQAQSMILPPTVLTSLIDIPQLNNEILLTPTNNTNVPQTPSNMNKANTIQLGLLEILLSPTLMMYWRNKTATFYQMMLQIPIISLLMMKDSKVDEHRTVDDCLCQWLTAVTNDYDFIYRNYNYITTPQIKKALILFKKLNEILDKKEDKDDPKATPQTRA